MKQLTYLLLLLLTCSSFAQSDTIVVRDLKLDWKTVDSEGKLDNKDLESSEIILFQIPEGTGQFLRISSPSSVDFWINDQLVFHDFSGTKVFFLSQLREKYGNLQRLSIYQKNGIAEVKSELIEVTNQSVLWNPNPRSFSKIDQVFLIQLLSTLLLAAVFYRVDPEIFYGYKSLLRLRKSGLDNTSELYTLTSVLKMIFLSVLIAISMSYFGLQIIGLEIVTITEGMFSWVGNFFFIFFLLSIKQFYAVLLSRVYGFRRAAILHLNGYSNLMIIAFLICVALLILDFSNPNSGDSAFKKLAVLTIGSAILLLQLWTFLKLDNQYSEKKLMIFTYLCTTEMAPGFLVLYWLDKIG